VALILQAAGVPPRGVRYLPYDGGGKAMLALLGGEVDVLSTGLGEVLSYVASGDVRILAIAADRRSPMLPDTPTLTELGYPIAFSNWRGLFAAPGISDANRDRLIALVRSATASEPWRQALGRYGWQSQVLLGEDFRQYLNAQETQLASVMRDLGFLN
jgi:putative tricarboxylic transport membrane protein